MTYAEAKKKLLKLADGRYCNIEFSETMFADGNVRFACRLGIGTSDYFISSYRDGDAETWDTAFVCLALNLANVVEKKPAVVIPVESLEAPNGVEA